MPWFKTKNDWLRRLVRGAALWAVMMVIAMLVPQWVFEGQIGTWLYTIGSWIITGFVMWHIVSNVPGKA